MNFDFQRKADVDHPVYELEAKYDIQTHHNIQVSTALYKEVKEHKVGKKNIGQFCLLMKPFSKHVNLLQSCKVKLRRSWMRLLLLEKAANLSAILLKEKLGDFFYWLKVFIGPKLRQVSKGNFHRKAPNGLEICQKIYMTENFRVKNLHRKHVIFDIC